MRTSPSRLRPSTTPPITTASCSSHNLHPIVSSSPEVIPRRASSPPCRISTGILRLGRASFAPVHTRTYPDVCHADRVGAAHGRTAGVGARDNLHDGCVVGRCPWSPRHAEPSGAVHKWSGKPQHVGDLRRHSPMGFRSSARSSGAVQYFESPDRSRRYSRDLVSFFPVIQLRCGLASSSWRLFSSVAVQRSKRFYTEGQPGLGQSDQRLRPSRHCCGSLLQTPSHPNTPSIRPVPCPHIRL